MPASAILVLSADAASAEPIQKALTAAGYTVTMEASVDAALKAAPLHQVVIVDRVTDERSPADVCRALRKSDATREIPILGVAPNDTVDERITFLEAGADDVMARPFDARELEARIEALLVRVQRSRDLSGEEVPVHRPRNRVVVVFSPKGGVGTTTIATNVGIVQARHRPDRVVLIDLDIQFGQVTTHLNLEVRQSLAEIVRDESGMREPEVLRTYSLRHDSGLHVLAAPSRPELGEHIEPRHLTPLLDTLGQIYETLIVDAGSELGERTLMLFDRADAVIVPVHPELAALKSVHQLLDFLGEIGPVPAKMIFVINNMFAREILKPRDVESALGSRVTAELPYDPFLYLKAVNEGIPVVIGAPRSAATERLTRLAEEVFGPPPGVTIGAGTEERRSRGLAGLLRRS